MVFVQERDDEGRNALRLSPLPAKQTLPLERLESGSGQVSLAAAGGLRLLRFAGLKGQMGRAVGVEQGPE